MKNLGWLVFLFLNSVQVLANELNLESFAKQYIEALEATQQVDAKPADLEEYLDFLADDVGTIHIPFNSDDTRYPDGKDRYRKSMSSMMGKNTKYKAEVQEIRVFNSTAISIRFKSSAVFVDKAKDVVSPWSMVITEILEIEDGKVAIIRRYHD